jgi:hypothetical protein
MSATLEPTRAATVPLTAPTQDDLVARAAGLVGTASRAWAVTPARHAFLSSDSAEEVHSGQLMGNEYVVGPLA